MIDEVEQNLSRRITERCKKLCLYEGWEPTSYFYNLGFVLGTSSKGLIYAHASAAAPHEQSKEAVTRH